MTVALLVLAVAVYFGPEVLPALFGGTRGAWEYVMNGFESSFLWAAVFVFVPKFEARAIAAWGLFEALQRPVCRLAFPMDRAPDLNGALSLCDAAFAVPMSALSVVAALGLAALAQETRRVARRA